MGGEGLTWEGEVRAGGPVGRVCPVSMWLELCAGPVSTVKREDLLTVGPML